MRKASIAAVGAVLLLGASAAVLFGAAEADSLAAAAGATNGTTSGNATCVAPGNVSRDMLWAHFVGDNTSLLPPWLSLNETAYQAWMSENGVNGTPPPLCHPQGHGHGHGLGLGPMGPPMGVPPGRCQNQTA